MRTNTQKLLLWLWTAQRVGHPQVQVWEVKKLLSTLSAGGFRSLLHHLEKQTLIRQEQVGNQTCLSITSHGQHALETAFPALSTQRLDWRGEWAMLTFLKAPSNDPQFRYLRETLLKQGAVSLSRGVYLYPGSFPASVTETCFQLYRSHVVITSIKKWQFGDERRIINDLFMLSDVVTSLSGVSSEVEGLLRTKQLRLDSEDQAKQPVFLVFDRLLSILEFDIGISHHYFPQSPTAVNLLEQILTEVYT